MTVRKRSERPGADASALGRSNCFASRSCEQPTDYVGPERLFGGGTTAARSAAPPSTSICKIPAENRSDNRGGEPLPVQPLAHARWAQRSLNHFRKHTSRFCFTVVELSNNDHKLVTIHERVPSDCLRSVGDRRRAPGGPPSSVECPLRSHYRSSRAARRVCFSVACRNGCGTGRRCVRLSRATNTPAACTTSVSAGN